LQYGLNRFSLPAKIAITLQFSKSNPQKTSERQKNVRMSPCPHGENARMAKKQSAKKSSLQKSSHPCSNRVAAPKSFPFKKHSGAAHRAAPPSSSAARRQASKNANKALSPEPFAPAFAFLSSLVREVLAALLAQSIINPRIWV